MKKNLGLKLSHYKPVLNDTVDVSLYADIVPNSIEHVCSMIEKKLPPTEEGRDFSVSSVVVNWFKK